MTPVETSSTWVHIQQDQLNVAFVVLGQGRALPNGLLLEQQHCQGQLKIQSDLPAVPRLDSAVVDCIRYRITLICLQKFSQFLS